MEGFKYQITLTVLLYSSFVIQTQNKWRHRICSYFNSATKTVIDSDLD